MYLCYMDESGSTGIDLDNKIQPFFVLVGIIVADKEWHKINDYFEQEKIKICPELKNAEIHTNELFNSNPKSVFYKNYWKDNLVILEKLVNLISKLHIIITTSVIDKRDYKKHFGNNIIVDPYLYSFAISYHEFNNLLIDLNDYGIIFCDEIKNMEKSLDVLYPKLKIENRNIIEKTYYIDSKKNNFIQIADICSFYINKYHCITQNNYIKGNEKIEHCLKMYDKLFNTIFPNVKDINISLDNYDNYFEQKNVQGAIFENPLGS